MQNHRLTVALPLALLLSFNACSESGPEPAVSAAPAVTWPVPQPGSIAGLSKTLAISGEYGPLALDRVSRLALDDGRVFAHGSASNLALQLPDSADTSRTTRHWALVTESRLDDGRRSLTFTHNESLEDFTIELPESPGALRYGGFEGRNGGEVLVFAWGESSVSYWGWVTIVPLTTDR